MKVGEDALPPPLGGFPSQGGSSRVVLVVASDIADHHDTTVGEIAARTALPQSQVSAAVARLKEAGSVESVTDPGDGRRVLVRQAAEMSQRVKEIRSTGIEDALADALDSDDLDALSEVTQALSVLARHFRIS